MELRKVSKSFAATRALQQLDLVLQPGEVHGLAGVNGAGKSTLIKVLTGAITDYEGELLVNGSVRRWRSPADSLLAGIAVVHQELSLVSSLSLEDALLLGLDARSLFAPIRPLHRRERARALLRRLDLQLDPTTRVASLSLADKQLAQIARALGGEGPTRLLVLDEPTSALAERESRIVLEKVRALAGQGLAVLFCTHRFDELYAIADRLTVVRDGSTAASGTTVGLPRERLLEHVLGAAKTTGAARAQERGGPDPVAGEGPMFQLAVDNLVVRRVGAARAEADRVSFTADRGEVLALAGVRGAGPEALLDALVGLVPSEGKMLLGGANYRPHSSHDAATSGVLMLSADRSGSVFGNLSIQHNATLSALRRWSRLGFVRTRPEASSAAQILRQVELTIRNGSLEQAMGRPASTLSGGTQQKLALGRCLLAEPRVLLLHEPTRGVDVGAQRELLRLIRAAARRCIVIVASSDLEEIVAIADRVLAFVAGKLVAQLDRGSIDRAELAAAILTAEGAAS